MSLREHRSRDIVVFVDYEFFAILAAAAAAAGVV